MIECDPAACAEIVQTQKGFITDAVTLTAAFALGIVFEKVASGAQGEGDDD